jgi:hypothetical protein
MSRPFVPLDAAWWPAIAERLEASGEPWPAEAVSMDLRWWADQERMGRRRRPGRPTLARRWGWSDRRARTIMADAEQWGDPFQRPARGQEPSSGRPAEDQPAPRRARARRDPGSSARPASGQPVSSARPQARVDTLTQHSDTRTQGDTPRPPAAQAPSGPPESNQGDRTRQAWDRAYARSTWGASPYPWELGHRGADHRRLRRWREAAGADGAGLRRLDAAIRAYLEAATAGLTWPRGDPPTTRRFTDEIAKWLQVGDAPGATANVRPHTSGRKDSRNGTGRAHSLAERAAARRVPTESEVRIVFEHPVSRRES